ncbi:MAG TPA: hypothetical protein DD379_15485 [Cyanobacteria bacterium UBA11162]|nr:hypothetical protein [Cyanobacteria bacterium UBA11162]
MTPLELRQKINQQLETLLPEQLALVSAFLDTLQPIQKKPPLRKLTPIKRNNPAINLMQFAGTWQGNDLDECRNFVHKNRTQAKF